MDEKPKVVASRWPLALFLTFILVIVILVARLFWPSSQPAAEVQQQPPAPPAETIAGLPVDTSCPMARKIEDSEPIISCSFIRGRAYRISLARDGLSFCVNAPDDLRAFQFFKVRNGNTGQLEDLDPNHPLAYITEAVLALKADGMVQYHKAANCKD